MKKGRFFLFTLLLALFVLLLASETNDEFYPLDHSTELVYSLRGNNETMDRRLISSLSSFSLFSKSDKQISKSRASGYKPAKGKRVALFQVHFEGNVGDQMETIPLLRKLWEWGAEVDCYLSVWLPLEKRLSPLVKEKVIPYVSNIYTEIPYTSTLIERDYDIAIIAPGPTVNELNYCFGPKNEEGEILHNVSMVYFGISIGSTRIAYTYERHKYCLKLVAAREPVSLRNAQELEKKTFKLILSGDISFSYLEDGKYEPPSNLQQTYPKIYQAVESVKEYGDDWVLVFSRENNFGGQLSVHIRNRKLNVRTIDNKIMSFDLDKVVFGSSDEIQDSKHLRTLRRQHGVDGVRTVTVNTVEEMFCLINYAPKVVTDRYHPGVASLILDKPLILTSYKQEAVKMSGLHGMIEFTPSKIRKLNQRAFDDLLAVLSQKKPVHKSNSKGKVKKHKKKHLSQGWWSS